MDDSTARPYQSSGHVELDPGESLTVQRVPGQYILKYEFQRGGLVVFSTVDLLKCDEPNLIGEFVDKARAEFSLSKADKWSNHF